MPALEGRIGVEPKREAYRSAFQFSDLAEDLWIGAEHVPQDVGFGRLGLVRQLLVGGKISNKLYDERNIVRLCRADDEGQSRYADS